MSFLFPVLLLLILVAVLAMCGGEGLWSNALTLFNLLTAAVLAINFWEPLADFLIKQVPKATYLWDFIALWLLFTVFMLIMRIPTDLLSRFKVRFHMLVERICGYIFAIWIGWVLVCFTTMSLHTAPLARDFLFKGFKPEKRMFFGMLAPDRQMLALAQKVSRGAFARGPSADNLNAHVFDPYGDFILKYASRRKQFERETGVLIK